MPYFKGQSYPLRTGMIVGFYKPEWKRSRGTYTKVGEVWITGKIVNDSYGELKGQHTFTVQDDNGKKHRIKGRHFYRTAEILDLGDYMLEERLAAEKAFKEEQDQLDFGVSVFYDSKKNKIFDTERENPERDDRETSEYIGQL